MIMSRLNNSLIVCMNAFRNGQTGRKGGDRKEFPNEKDVQD